MTVELTMGGDGFWARFVVASLAAWRITHLLAHEDGPGDILARLRASLGSGFWGRLMDCFYCLSMWVAAPLAALVSFGVLEGVLVWVALSGAACLLERATAPPVQFSRIQNFENDQEEEK